METKGFFYFEIIINALVSSFRFIWIPMLWVYGRSKYIYCHSAGIDFRRQNPSGAETTKPGEISAYYIRILRVGLLDLALWGSLVYMSTVDKTGAGLPCCGDLRVFSCCHLAWAGSLCSFRGHPVPPCDATWCDYGQIARWIGPALAHCRTGVADPVPWISRHWIGARFGGVFSGTRTHTCDLVTFFCNKRAVPWQVDTVDRPLAWHSWLWLGRTLGFCAGLIGQQWVSSCLSFLRGHARCGPLVLTC